MAGITYKAGSNEVITTVQTYRNAHPYTTQESIGMAQEIIRGLGDLFQTFTNGVETTRLSAATQNLLTEIPTWIEDTNALLIDAGLTSLEKNPLDVLSQDPTVVTALDTEARQAHTAASDLERDQVTPSVTDFQNIIGRGSGNLFIAGTPAPLGGKYSAQQETCLTTIIVAAKAIAEFQIANAKRTLANGRLTASIQQETRVVEAFANGQVDAYKKVGYVAAGAAALYGLAAFENTRLVQGVMAIGAVGATYRMLPDNIKTVVNYASVTVLPTAAAYYFGNDTVKQYMVSAGLYALDKAANNLVGLLGGVALGRLESGRNVFTGRANP